MFGRYRHLDVRRFALGTLIWSSSRVKITVFKASEISCDLRARTTERLGEYYAGAHRFDE